MEDDHLPQFLNLIETSYLQYSTGNAVEAKKLAISAIKVLNRMDLLKYDSQISQDLPKFSLQHYDVLKNNKLCVSDQLQWMSSKLTSFFPPLIDFNGIDSLHRIFVANKYIEQDTSVQLVPKTANIRFQEAKIVDWSANTGDFVNLYQDLLPNCSFVSSLLAMAQCDTQLLTQLIVSNADNSAFKVKFYFNGCWRIVDINNELPFLPDDKNRNIIIRSFTNADLLWPALIEKAYLKVMGQGYEFNGSNMSTDTYMLSGWLPEIVTLKNFTLPPNFDELWNLMKQKKVMLGIGTGNISKDLSNQLNLISNHDYVIEDYDQFSKELTIKNPWAKTDAQADRLVKLSGTLYFKYLYINWNPCIYKHKYSLTFISNKTANTRDRAQFSFINPTDKQVEVCLLLERHLVQKDQEVVIDFQIYETNSGEKVFVPMQFPKKTFGTATNNRLKFTKFIMEPNQAYTIVITSSSKTILSLSLNNNTYADLQVCRAKHLYSNILSINGSWTSLNNGGNWALASYILNPQYDVEVPETSDLLVALLPEDKTCIISFHLMNTEGTCKTYPIRCFDKTKLVADANYNTGYQICQFQNLAKGSYKLVLSTYHKNTFVNYTLLVNYSGSPDSLVVNKIPNSIGLYMKSKLFNWNNGNRYKLFIQTASFNSKVTFHVHNPYNSQEQISTTQYTPAIRGSVFREIDSQPVVINETWNNSVYGIFVDCVAEQPGTYILLVERFEAGYGGCVIDIGCDKNFVINLVE